MDLQPLRDLIEALELRRLVALSTAAGVVLLGLVVSYLAPGILPPHPLVGAAVGIAALTIGMVAAVAADAGDEVVRGSRHVRATGAVVAAEGHHLLDDLTGWARHQVSDSPQLSLAVVGAGAGDLRAARIAETIGESLARGGHRVLVADLSSERADGPGIAEVGRGEEKLSQAVTFSSEVDLARVASGRPLTDGLVALPRIAPRLHGDVEVLVAALPGLRQPGTLLAATAAGRSLMLVTAGVTTRVEVIAGLQALDAAHAPADIVIVPEGGFVDLATGVPIGGTDRTGAAADPATHQDQAAVEDAGADEVDGPVGDPDDVDDRVDEGSTLDPILGPDLGEDPFGDTDDWTAPIEPVTTDEPAPEWEEQPLPGWDEDPEPRWDDQPEAYDDHGAGNGRSGYDGTEARDTDGPSGGRSAHDELQRIASVIALERELSDRDDDDEADGVA